MEKLPSLASVGQSGLSEEPEERPTFAWTGTNLPAVDYVLVYEKDSEAKKAEMREQFLAALRARKRGGSARGIETEVFEQDADNGGNGLVFVKIFVPFNILAREAEKLKLEMPLDKSVTALEDFDLVLRIGECCRLIEDDEEDYISGPFARRKLHLFKGHQDKETFFRPALRSYLTYNILINTGIGYGPKASGASDVKDKDISKIALPKLLHLGVFKDAFTLHEPSANDPWLSTLKKDWLRRCPDDFRIDKTAATERDVAKLRKLEAVRQVGQCRFDYDFSPDERSRLDQVWTKIFKYQPLDRVRNYFGEKIAFYFAWSGHMITMLWVPTVIGFGIFVYGLVLSIQRNMATTVTTTVAPTTATGTTVASVNGTTTSTDLQKIMNVVDNMLATVKEAFDNMLTPIFAIIICLWGTLHTEMWKRYRSTLAYEWDVNSYEHAEPDRPEFVGTIERVDPITNKTDRYYPGGRQAMKFLTSFIILVVMICVVFIGVAAVIVYRVFVTIRVCPTTSSTNCLILNTVVSSLMNALFIILIGKVYDRIAYLLTDWENHRTQSEYNNALIIKLFAFQFANSYSSLFYIAFFRGENLFMPENGIFGLGKEFIDTCGTDGNCMSMLSFQVLVLMITKPMPKLLMDHGLPLVVRLFRRCRKRCCRGQIESADALPPQPNNVNEYILNEYSKFDLGDFTIEEYMEKIIQFGYLMLFAASFPLAPLIALLTNLFDTSTDAYRMLWIFRRPIATISQDIGMWHDIVEFMNVAGVISNACIIAFTASWVKLPQFSDTFNNLTSKLLIVLVVENAVLGLKYFISAVIPDVPSLVQLQIRRERYRVPKILAAGNLK